MKDINALKSITNQGTGKFVLLSFLTVGIYPMMWGWKNTEAFNAELDTKPFESNIFITLAILFGISAYADMFSIISDFMNYGYIIDNSNMFDVISKFLTFAMFVIWVVWSFRMKAALEFYAAKNYGMVLRLNGVWTFLFQHFYINYCMNDLENDLAKEKMLAGVRQNLTKNSNSDADSDNR